jgi:hypothetical protein
MSTSWSNAESELDPTLIAAGLGVIGYRLFRAEGSTVVADVTALWPKGAR